MFDHRYALLLPVPHSQDESGQTHRETLMGIRMGHIEQCRLFAENLN